MHGYFRIRAIVFIGHLQRGNEFKRAFQAATVHDFFNVLAVIILLPIEIAFGLLEKSASWLGVQLFGTISTVSYTHLTLPTKRIV